MAVSVAVRELVDATAPLFELRHAHTERDSPLVALGLAHVAHWLSAAALPFAASDGELVEVFSPPRGSSNAERLRPSELRPTTAGDLLQPALDAFAAKSSMVINSLHRWDATAARLADALQAELRLPVDVYMYLTPPRSHSYGLHADVMDAFMVQLVGRKNWTVCAAECEHLELRRGDVLYLPMGTRHHAWTEGSLSAHLTVNVERQFVVWGALLTATACRLLLDARKCGSALQPFGMEGETALSRALQSLAEQNGAPRLLRTPDALGLRRRGAPAADAPTLHDEWAAVVDEARAAARLADDGGAVDLEGARGARRFASVSSLLDELAAAPDAATRAALDWTDDLLRRHLRASMPSHLERQRAGGAAEACDADEAAPLPPVAVAGGAEFEAIGRRLADTPRGG